MSLFKRTPQCGSLDDDSLLRYEGMSHRIHHIDESRTPLLSVKRTKTITVTEDTEISVVGTIIDKISDLFGWGK